MRDDVLKDCIVELQDRKTKGELCRPRECKTHQFHKNVNAQKSNEENPTVMLIGEVP